MAVELERVIPLPQAAKQMGMTVEALTHLVTSGRLEAVQLPGGEIAVRENEMQGAITREQFKHLRGKPITISQATQPGPRNGDKGGYGIPYTTIYGWIARGYITVTEPGYKMILDEADVAYCTAVYRERKSLGVISGVPLLDDVGRPYVLKHPKLAEYRHRKKAQAKPKSIRMRK